jgi:hypothetical protein
MSGCRRAGVIEGASSCRGLDQRRKLVHNLRHLSERFMKLLAVPGTARLVL